MAYGMGIVIADSAQGNYELIYDEAAFAAREEEDGRNKDYVYLETFH